MVLVLHAIVLKKPFIKSKEDALAYARKYFKNEDIKGFVRETDDSYRVRVVPKTQFIKTSYVSKVLSDKATLVLGRLKANRATDGSR
jgi:hypothetical protein